MNYDIEMLRNLKALYKYTDFEGAWERDRDRERQTDRDRLTEREGGRERERTRTRKFYFPRIVL